MSRVIACSKPASRAKWAPPITPPASPESSSSTGRSGACASPVVPPSDLSSEQGPFTLRSRSAAPMLGQ